MHRNAHAYALEKVEIETDCQIVREKDSDSEMILS